MTPLRRLRYKGRPGFVARKEAMMEANDKAPDFSLLDENSAKVALKDFRGKNVVLYFFPKADTPG